MFCLIWVQFFCIFFFCGGYFPFSLIIFCEVSLYFYSKQQCVSKSLKYHSIPSYGLLPIEPISTPIYRVFLWYDITNFIPESINVVDSVTEPQVLIEDISVKGSPFWAYWAMIPPRLGLSLDGFRRYKGGLWFRDRLNILQGYPMITWVKKN